MSKEERPDELGRGADQDDEVEILEIVPVDEDMPPSGDQDDEEVEVFFEEPDRKPVAETAETAEPPLFDDPAPVMEEEEAREETVSKESLLRLQAEFENLKKRSEKEREDFFLHATSSLVSRLLPVIDNFERALATDQAAAGEEAFREGVALIYRQMMEELRKEGLRPIDAMGEVFDPSEHEAVATGSSPDHPPNTVIDELQKGYYFQKRLLRPAMVRVNLDPGPAEEGENDSESET